MGTIAATVPALMTKLLSAPPAFLVNFRSLSMEEFVPRTLLQPLYFSLFPRVLAPLLLRSYQLMTAVVDYCVDPMSKPRFAKNLTRLVSSGSMFLEDYLSCR